MVFHLLYFTLSVSVGTPIARCFCDLNNRALLRAPCISIALMILSIYFATTATPVFPYLASNATPASPFMTRHDEILAPIANIICSVCLRPSSRKALSFPFHFSPSTILYVSSTLVGSSARALPRVPPALVSEAIFLQSPILISISLVLLLLLLPPPPSPFPRPHTKVFKVRNKLSDDTMALKVIKALPAYTEQAKTEVIALRKLERAPLNAAKRAGDAFVNHMDTAFMLNTSGHNILCILVDLCGESLFDRLQRTVPPGHHRPQGFALDEVRLYCGQILAAVRFLHANGVVHADLKPENVLTVVDPASGHPYAKVRFTREWKSLSRTLNLKAKLASSFLSTRLSPQQLIDFGSSIVGNVEQPHFYIQSRFYRAPEVLVGKKSQQPDHFHFDGAIDMWSLGCIAAELFTGEPLFQGSCHSDQLRQIESLMGPLPTSLLADGHLTEDFYHRFVPADSNSQREHYRLLHPVEHEATALYFNHKYEPPQPSPRSRLNLDCLQAVALRNRADLFSTAGQRLAFADLLRGLLQLEPDQRWTAEQASCHPFWRRQDLPSNQK